MSNHFVYDILSFPCLLLSLFFQYEDRESVGQGEGLENTQEVCVRYECTRLCMCINLKVIFYLRITWNKKRTKKNCFNYIKLMVGNSHVYLDGGRKITAVHKVTYLHGIKWTDQERITCSSTNGDNPITTLLMLLIYICTKVNIHDPMDRLQPFHIGHPV